MAASGGIQEVGGNHGVPERTHHVEAGTTQDLKVVLQVVGHFANAFFGKDGLQDRQDFGQGEMLRCIGRVHRDVHRLPRLGAERQPHQCSLSGPQTCGFGVKGKPLRPQQFLGVRLDLFGGAQAAIVPQRGSRRCGRFGLRGPEQPTVDGVRSGRAFA